MSNLQVIFGTGPLARSVMQALRKRNLTIRMVNRSGKRADIPDDVEVIASDAYNESNVRDITRDASVVYQCAQPDYRQWKAKFPPLQTAILNGVVDNGAKLIVGENLYMYGDTDGAIIHEDLPYQAHGVKGTVRAKMSEELLVAHQAGKIQVAMARGSNFYGEGVRLSTIGERVFEFMLEGKSASVFGNIDLPHTVTYIGDFGEAMAILGEREEALGRAWHVPNAEPEISTREMIERIAAEMNIAPQIGTMPKLLFEALSLVHPYLREMREMRYEFEKPYIVDSSQFIKNFGDISTPIDEGIRNTVQWYKSQMSVTA